MAGKKRKKRPVKNGQKEKRKNKNLLYVITSRTVMSIMAGLLVISYLSAYINPARIWLLTIFGLCFIPLAIINFILLLWAIRRQSRSFLIPLVALLPSLFYIGRYVQVFSDAREFPSDSQQMKLMTYNVGRFSASDEGRDKSGCAEDIFTFLKLQDPDIICLQEVWIRDIGRVKSYFRSEMPGYDYRYCLAQGRNGSFGNVTFSRYPIIASGKIKFDKSANMAIYTDICSDQDTFRVYNCHFESYNISLPHIVKSLGKDHQKVLKETGVKLEASITRRPEQVGKVLANISASEREAIVCGDFNDTPMSYTYNKLMKGRNDAFVASGSGFGATYRFLWPALRIDYALFPDHYRIKSYDIHKVGYSDHYPVLTDFQI